MTISPLIPQSSQSLHFRSVTSIVKITPTAVFFHAVMDPLHQQLYRVELDKPGQVTQLSQDGFYHICEVSSRQHF